MELGIVDANADLASLNRGRVSAIMDCRECHRQYWPQEFTAKRWPDLADEMGEEAFLRDDEIDELIAYLVAASKTLEFEEALQAP